MNEWLRTVKLVRLIAEFINIKTLNTYKSNSYDEYINH